MGIRQTGVTIGGLAAAFLLPPVAVRFGWEAALVGFAVDVTGSYDAPIAVLALLGLAAYAALLPLGPNAEAAIRAGHD